MKTIKYSLSALGLAIGMAATGLSMTVSAAEPTLSKADFEKAQLHYFQRCAGCHGVLRKGATGKNLEPENTLKKGQTRLEKIIALGTEGGMNNFDDLFSELAVQGSIKGLFAGDIVNNTEDRPASHHRYRDIDPIPEFNFKKICAPLLQQIKKEKYQNIIIFGIGGSYEGPKLLQEFLLPDFLFL